jgi:hypothetical protein
MLVLICGLYPLNTVAAFFISMMTNRWLTRGQSTDLPSRTHETK